MTTSLAPNRGQQLPARQIASYEGVFTQHGVLTHVAKATLGVVRDRDRQSHDQSLRNEGSYVPEVFRQSAAFPAKLVVPTTGETHRVPLVKFIAFD